jgi:hypothetical protein
LIRIPQPFKGCGSGEDWSVPFQEQGVVRRRLVNCRRA